MKFTKIIGEVNERMVEQAENKLSQVFLELGTRYNNEHVGSGMGGDPLIFGLMYPVEHICTNNIPTAATDGKRYYWSPKFVIKTSRIGLRLICSHEAWHALYMHPQRRGSRLPKLWNIAVDYIVNNTAMEDLKARRLDPQTVFTKNLGRYMTLDQYSQLLKDPFKPIPGFEDINPMTDANSSDEKLPLPNEDRELTSEEKKTLERKEKGVKFFFADPDLSEDMKSPEKIYDMLYALLPKCPKCGRIGYYKPPQNNDGKKGKKEKKSDKNQGDQGDQQGKGQGKQKQDCGCGDDCDGDCGNGNCGCGDKDGNGCPVCGGGVDIFGIGGTVDEHFDTEESEEKLAKRISDAMEAAKRMAGSVPSALEDELGKLTAPKVTWQDIVRTRLYKARSGHGRNDWTRFKTRPMFAGLMVPKRRCYYAHFGCLLDTSGSMSRDDMAFGLSQLQSLDERSEGTIVPADAQIYWEQATKIRKANAEEICKVKITGRGGTMFGNFFDEYEKNIGTCDFLIVITDGYLLSSDMADMKNPGIDVLWLITSGSSFTPPFGRSFDLRGI